MNLKQFKEHFAKVAKRVAKLEPKHNQLAIGFGTPISNFELIGYFHKTRIHKTKLKICDFHKLRYLIPAGDNIHYAEGDICQNGVEIKKVLVLKEK